MEKYSQKIDFEISDLMKTPTKHCFENKCITLTNNILLIKCI